MHNDTFHRTERHTTVPIPAEILSSTPSPVHLFENDASATTSTTSAHAEERDLHYPTTCSALDVTGVSALSPSPQKCSPLHEEVRRRLGKIELTPDDFLATSSPPPGKAHRLRAGYPFGEPQAENAACSSIGDSHSGLPRRSPAALRSGNPTSVSGDVPAPLSLSVSPPLRGRLPFDAAAGEDEVEERDQPAHVPSSSSALNSSSLGQPFDSVLVSPLPTESVTTPPTQELIFLHCRRVLQEELAAREWIEVDASVHLHHLACEERVGYRVAEAVQYYRRLQDASLHPMFNGITPADLITPPTRKQRNSEEGTPRAGASDSTASPTSPLSCVQRRRRMPSANSLPPLSPCRKTPPAEEEMRNGCVSEETDAGNGVSPPSSPGACSLSSSQEQACDSAKEGGSGVAAKRLDNHSSSRSPVKVEEDEPNGDSFVTRGTPADAAGASDSCAAGEDPDKVLYGSDDSGDWEDASETENANKEDEQQEDGEGASTSQMEFGDALALPDCEADATQCSAVDTVDASVKPPLYSPASRESDEAANTPASARRPSPLRRILNRTAHSICLLRDVQSDEEDARYLLTGNCPPPHVFQRWADRFLREQQHTAAQTTGGGEEERRHEKGSTPSPDASEPTIHTTEVQSAAKRGMGVLEIDLCMDSQSDRRSLESPATAREVSRRKDVPEKPLAAMASEASASCDGDRSTSRQRQCSERYRDGVLRSFCADLDDGGHAVWPSGERDSSRLREVDGADVDREYNATGRYAPDPQFFDEDGCLLRSPSSLRSSSALLNDASPTLLFPSDMAGPSAANVTALPESTSTDALPVTDAETLAASFSAPPAAAFAPLTYPSEETYDAPCGSERNAWQMLMDDFIEGLVKLMRDEV
ncbi:hypothetical protein ABB37_04450 [Leptomonas pyrrhocoris]|uniref:Uncharacterized protein n=1 Tax=Leptomonas pyrrhocoris TaxID=157538 RepID=A0A0N0DW06_LEPPY|nr:hypothetical protein ABB37_04450 [Leptomonas pyrrhocoris]KPA81092.1 hypothetical protein ABB37_04450 [Leptomonas pyrrhocoris]|eukprot:XP_015659531.1 hypothetical protein ABB37_04450 [Leptomonas pyrrhocoris]